MTLEQTLQLGSVWPGSTPQANVSVLVAPQNRNDSVVNWNTSVSVVPPRLCAACYNMSSNLSFGHLHMLVPRILCGGRCTQTAAPKAQFLRVITHGNNGNLLFSPSDNRGVLSFPHDQVKGSSSNRCTVSFNPDHGSVEQKHGYGPSCCGCP